MWHIGVFYRVIDIISFLSTERVLLLQFKEDFKSFHDVPTKVLLKVAFEGEWISVDNDGYLVVTRQGAAISAIDCWMQRLRTQIRTLTDKTSPPWLPLVLQGRNAFISYAPQNVVECFELAGFFSNDSDSVTFWDNISAKYWMEKEKRNLEIGRKGELLSLHYEKARTGREPKWIALEYSGAGYDLLSTNDKSDSSTLLVEVKASEKPLEYAFFYLTRNEWDTLSKHANSVLHLWLLSENGKNRFFVVSVKDVESHVPNDNGCGTWHALKMPFVSFDKYALE